MLKFWKNCGTCDGIMARFWVCLWEVALEISLHGGEALWHDWWHDGHGTWHNASGFEHYIRLHSSYFEESFKIEKLGKSKEITLRLRVFGEGSLERLILGWENTLGE